MKSLYKIILLLFLFTALVFGNMLYAQCPDGSPSGGTAYDTTILIPAGIVNKEVKFPQFDPQTGMVTCVNLCVTIKGIVDTVALQNFSSSSQNGSYTYDRTDQITGPGIITPLTSTANLSFGPFPLTAYDGTPSAGPDFYSQGSDTVLTRVLCSNISDSATIAQFYGTDSVSYGYDVNASAIGVVPGGSSSTLVLSSAQVNFHFEYCTCPATVLPLNVHSFNIQRLTANKAELNWTGYDDAFAEYHYEAEVSKEFTSIGSVEKSNQPNSIYKLAYSVDNGQRGVFYFRVKQVYTNGYVRYSNIKQLELESSVVTRFSVYPNPSKGIVGIKFDNKMHGQFNIQIYNTQGQAAVRKDVSVAVGSPYMELANMPPGVYWLRVTDRKSLESSVTQLLIK
jgi:Secretion system C-terminal sorting domain